MASAVAFIDERRLQELLTHVDDAEPIALGIGEDNVVSIERSLVPVHLGGPERDQAFDLFGLALCVQIKMNAWWQMDFRADPVEGEVWPDTVPRPQQHEVVVARPFPRHIVESSHPERSLALQVVHAQNN